MFRVSGPWIEETKVGFFRICQKFQIWYEIPARGSLWKWSQILTNKIIKVHVSLISVNGCQKNILVNDTACLNFECTLLKHSEFKQIRSGVLYSFEIYWRDSRIVFLNYNRDDFKITVYVISSQFLVRSVCKFEFVRFSWTCNSCIRCLETTLDLAMFRLCGIREYSTKRIVWFVTLIQAKPFLKFRVHSVAYKIASDLFYLTHVSNVRL